MPVALDNREWSYLLADRSPVGETRGTHASAVVGWTSEVGAGLLAWSEQRSVSQRAVALALSAAIVARYDSDAVSLQATSRLMAPETTRQAIRFAAVHLDLTDDPSFAELAQRAQQLIDEYTTRPAAEADDDVVSAPIVCDWSGAEEPVALRAARGSASAAEICLSFSTGPAGLVAALSVDEDRWSPGYRRAFAGALVELATRVLAMPDQPMSTHCLLSEADAHRVLHAWNATEVPRRGDLSLPKLFERQADATPLSIAVEHEGVTVTYRELNARANQLARELVKRGVRRDVLVGVAMERSLELVVAIIAVLKAGGAFVPLDPDLPADRLTYILTDTRAPLLLVQAHLSERLHAAATMADTDLLQIPPLHDVAYSGPASNLAIAIDGEQVSYLIYTSGSTGQPKGVCIPQRAVCNHALWFSSALQMTTYDRMLQYASISFDASIAELFAPLVTGATVVLASPYAHRDVLGVADVVRAERVTLLQMVPSALRAALAAAAFTDVPTLRYLVSGGEALDRATVAALRRATPQVQLGNFYGPTEASVDSTMIVVDGSLDDRSIIPIGRPIANARCYILDRHLQPVPVGAPGELYIAGRGLALGYHNQAALTASRFIADPFHAGERMYRSGDVARYHADGTIEYLGRADTQVKVRGYRIELAEIESALLHHPGVREAAVVVRPDELGEPTLVAYLVCAVDAAAPSPQAIMARLRQRLPVYAVPSAYAFLPALPLTTSAKLDRRALEQLPLPRCANTPRGERLPLADVYEQRLRGIWEAMLGVSPVDVDDDFFALGGHSLKAIRLLNEVEREFGIDIRAGVLFEAPTIRKFAMRLRERKARPVSTTIPVQPLGNALPLFFVPGGAGELFVFDALARELGSNQPLHVMDLYAFGDQPTSVTALPEAPSLTMADIAARMIRDMREIQPHGPYQLAGYSLGGNIALEIAQQLRAQSEAVGMILLLDCDGPGYPYLQPFVARTFTHIRYALSLGPRSAIRYVTQRTSQLTRKMRGTPPPPHTLFDKEEDLALVPPNVIERMERALAPLIAAWEAYVPGRYDGPVTLVRADIRQHMVGVIDVDPLLGWGGVLTNLTTARMACGHFDLLRAPQAPRLAEILRSVLAPAPSR
ncbi:MAG: amino acid adenylation domain-containing protein [Gemmatimonadaceae bacterium]|nr:amino acid adenylation domain-containing protein [Gemmatimonadaceae bacterium]